MARVDPGLVDTLRADDLLDRILPGHLYSTLDEAMSAFRSDAAARAKTRPDPPPGSSVAA